MEPYITKNIDGFSMSLRSDDPGISRVLGKPKYWKKWHREPEFMDIIVDSVDAGMTVLDLGANIGYVSLHVCKQIGANGFLYAIEPEPNNFKVLKKNIADNNFSERVSLDSLAFSDSNSSVKMYISSHSNMNSIVGSGDNYIEVPSRTLDSYFQDKNRLPNFIKMDIEGAEVEVLSGLDSLIDNVKTIRILMEVHPDKYTDDRFANQLLRLCDRGFKFKYVVSATTAKPRPFIDKNYSPIKTYKSGKWSRGVYENVDPEDAISFLHNSDMQRIYINKSAILRNPGLIKDRIFETTKIVRAIMLEK